MKQDLRLKKLLKEEIKQILLQEGLMDKAREYMGVAAVGTALGLLPALAPEEGERSRSTASQEERPRSQLIQTVLPQGIDSVEDLQRLDDQEFIAAIQLMIENMQNSGISPESKINLKDSIKDLINRRMNIGLVKTTLLRQLHRSN
jgi:hypothetical protein